MSALRSGHMKMAELLDSCAAEYPDSFDTQSPLTRPMGFHVPH